jgi:hypothetical protein
MPENVRVEPVEGSERGVSAPVVTGVRHAERTAWLGAMVVGSTVTRATGAPC